ncbi:diuretic hormone receptor isoform X4 [Cryptotermes secundus]|uniref:diuretic hormone receptor isoform X4 n=1 Tax=Cryptotermes secundus TaxID=105785 RepID=UPI000CD7CD57|nr:diuretic hormone receptor isoform X4 [Cryptotermes secundus]
MAASDRVSIKEIEESDRLKELLNHTDLLKEVECYSKDADSTGSGEASVLFCPNFYDTLLCWPKTPAGTLAVLPCLEELNGIKYDTTQNASRFCHSNGTWDNYTNYKACVDMPLEGQTETGVETATTLYFIGYTMSLVALSIAVGIFLYYKDLRCLRNTIHTNLMSTYMLADLFWILTLILQISMQEDSTSCVILVVLLHYFHLTNFFWMFVEGLYLYMLVVETFTGENIKLRFYVVLGWGAPVVIVILWAIVKSFAPIPTEPQAPTADPGVLRNCPWWSPHAYDWIYQGPAVAVLGINSIFLLMIMWVLITKLRATNNAETQQYRKATKALLVLIPLLGITYILVITGPAEGIPAAIYDYVTAVLLSTQGFTIALFYCFLNTEVQNTVRHHFERWKTARSLGGNRRYNYSSKDWSPRSRTESIRLSIRTSNASGTGVCLPVTATITTPTYGPNLTVENAV